MRYLAIDYGLKRVGTAICDRQEMIVSPLTQLQLKRRQADELIRQLQTLCRENQVEAFVVGLPLNMDSTEGPQAQLTRTFAAQLVAACNLPCYLQDERLSSNSADEMLAQAGLDRKKGKDKRDMLAACAILQAFLDRKSMDPDFTAIPDIQP